MNLLKHENMLETLSTTSPGQDLYQHVSCEICGIWNGRSLVLKVELHLANSPNLAMNKYKYGELTMVPSHLSKNIHESSDLQQERHNSTSKSRKNYSSTKIRILLAWILPRQTSIRKHPAAATLVYTETWGSLPPPCALRPQFNTKCSALRRTQ